MKTRTGMIGIAAILTAAALSGGIAQARTGQPATTKPAAETVQTTDTDSLQQGDQTSPDTPAKAAHGTSGQGTGGQVKENQGENANEGASENQGESEQGNDGPGGHQDPPGDVQHEGGNNEK